MKNSYLLLLVLFLISCIDSEKKIAIPLEKTVIKDTTVVLKEKVAKNNRLIFTIQIAALKQANKTFAKIDGVAIYQENTLTKYRLGTFETYNEARKYRKKLLLRYQGAFVQALKNETPVSISEALKD